MMKSLKSLVFAAMVLASIMAGGALAAEAPPGDKTTTTAAEETTKKTLKLDDVVVRGDTLREGLAATSATVLDNAEIVDRVYVTPLDMLKLSPGITINQYHQGGTAAAFQMRGFTSCSHGPDAAIFLDGIPLNETDGYADTNYIIPEEIERVEVVKGPASALYGNYASAGSVAFYTIKSGDFTRFKLQYGSFNTQDAVAVIARKEGKLDQVYAAEVYHTDGYQDNSTWNKQNVAGRWTYALNDRLDATFSVRAFNSTWDSPGYIPQSVYDSNPSRSVSDVNGGKKKRGEARADARYKLSDNSKLMVYAWAHQQDFTRWYQNWISSSQKIGSNYGDERFFQREVMGTGVSYNYLGRVLERETRFVVGLDFMDEKENRERWNLVVGNGRNRGSKYQDFDITLYTTALYSELNYQIFKPLRLVVGGRYDMFSGELNERIPSGTYDRSGPEIFSPKAALVYTLLKDYEIFTGYGKGFALPRDRDLWKRSYLDPAIRTQYEGGLRGRPVKWVDFGLTAWRLDTTDDFQAKVDDPNTLENAGTTRREGIEAEINLYPWKHVRLHLDYAYIDARYTDYFDGTAQRDGNRLTSVPENVFNAELSYEPELGLGGRLRYRWVSDWNVDAANTIKADGFQTVDAQVSYRFDKRYRLALDIINLFDATYSEYVGYANNEKIYAPGDPLSAYLTLTIDW